MLPSRRWNREGGTLEASHSLLMRRSLGGEGDVDGEVDSSTTAMSSEPAMADMSFEGRFVKGAMGVSRGEGKGY